LLGGSDSLASKVLSNVVGEDEKLELEALSKVHEGQRPKNLVIDEIRLLVDRVCALANQVGLSSDPLIAQVLSLKGAPSSSEGKSKRRHKTNMREKKEQSDERRRKKNKRKANMKEAMRQELAFRMKM
jgi:hypothetical protein